MTANPLRWIVQGVGVALIVIALTPILLVWLAWDAMTSVAGRDLDLCGQDGEDDGR